MFSLFTLHDVSYSHLAGLVRCASAQDAVVSSENLTRTSAVGESANSSLDWSVQDSITAGSNIRRFFGGSRQLRSRLSRQKVLPVSDGRGLDGDLTMSS